jgi:hypothetical protein
MIYRKNGTQKPIVPSATTINTPLIFSINVLWDGFLAAKCATATPYTRQIRTKTGFIGQLIIYLVQKCKFDQLCRLKISCLQGAWSRK